MTRAIVGAYEIDFRILLGDEVRWISAHGQGNDADILGRIMHGIFSDHACAGPGASLTSNCVSPQWQLPLSAMD